MALAEVPGKHLTYLRADRFAPEFYEAISSDSERIFRAMKEGEEISPLDLHTTVQATIDLRIGAHLSTWGDGKTVPWRQIFYARRDFAKQHRQENKFADENAEVIADIGFDNSLAVLAVAGMLKVRSELNPGWNPHLLETWIRRGATYACLPLFTEFFTRRVAPVRGPSSRNVDESLIRLACVSETLRAVIGKVLDTPAIPASKRQYISGLSGLLIESDALTSFYEDGPTHEPGFGYWHFPAQPHMDFGPPSPLKGDILTLRMAADKTQIGLQVFDMKLPPGQARSVSEGVMQITSAQIGSTINDNGKVKGRAGIRCDDYLDGHLDAFEDTRYDSPTKRMARAVSILGISMAEVHHMSHMATNSVCGDGIVH